MDKKMYVVYCEDDGTYWCGLNTWDKQLRKAKVFHWLKYANEVHDRFKELKLKNVEIRMELAPENPTNADRIRAMSYDELADFLWGFDTIEIARENECLLTKRKIDEWLKQPAKENDND